MKTNHKSIVAIRGERLATLLLEAMETGARFVAIGNLWTHFSKGVTLPNSADIRSLEDFRRVVESFGLNIYGVPGQIRLEEAEDFATVYGDHSGFGSSERIRVARRNCLAKLLAVQIGKGDASHLVSDLNRGFLGIARFHTHQTLISYLRSQNLNVLKHPRSGRLHLALDEVAARFVMEVVGKPLEPSPFMGRRAFQARADSIPEFAPQGDPVFSGNTQKQNSLF